MSTSFGWNLKLLYQISRHYLSFDMLTSLPLQQGSPSVLLLGQVCKAWRAFTLSTPTLWTSLRIEFPQDIEERAAENLTALVNLWMDRSGDRTLNLQMNIYPTLCVGVDDPIHSCSPAILHILAPLLASAHRWRHVHIGTTLLALKCLTQEGLTLSGLSAPHLVSFGIDGEESGAEAFDESLEVLSRPVMKFSAAPSLRKVSLSEIGLLAAHSSAFPWNSVEDLRLSGIYRDLSFQEYAGILHQCTALKHCSISTSFAARIPLSLTHSVRPIRLEALESLDITEHSPPEGGSEEIYRHMVCFELDQLKIRYVLRDYLEIHSNTSYWVRDGVMALLDMSPQLTKLELWSLPMGEMCLIELLGAIPGLTHLTVISWRAIHSAGDKLLHELSLTTSSGDFVLLKDLEYFQIESHACSETSVAAFVRSRRSVSPIRLKEISINLLGNVTTDIMSSRLTKYEEEGLTVSIPDGVQWRV